MYEMIGNRPREYMRVVSLIERFRGMIDLPSFMSFSS